MKNIRFIVKVLLLINIIVIACIIFNNAPFQKIDITDEVSTSSLLNEVKIESGNIITTSYYNEDGILTFADDKHFASKVQTLDSNGNVILEEYFDEKGDPCEQPSEYYSLKKEYNDLNQNIKDVYLDQEGKPMINKSGYSSVIKEYNENNLVVKETYFDLEGNAVLNTSYYHGKVYEYNELGQSIKITYIGKDGKPVLNSSYVAMVKRTFYDDNKVESEMYYDLNGNPTKNSDGYYGVLKEYDEYGRNIKTTSLDQYGNPGINEKGYTIIKRTFYNDSNFKSGLYFDKQENPVSIGNNKYGSFRTRDGKWIYFDQNQKECFILDKYLEENVILIPFLILLCIFVTILLPKRINILFVLVYILVILYITLFIRTGIHVSHRYELFWSYKQFFSNANTRKEIILNVLLFVPLGYLLGFIRSNKKWILLPILLSIMIELIQLRYGLGFFEYDDIISNSLGGILGYIIGIELSIFIKE